MTATSHQDQHNVRDIAGSKRAKTSNVPDIAGGRGRRRREKVAVLPTLALFAGAIYCLIPVAWVVVAASKSSAELFATFTFAPGTSLGDNLADLSAYRGGLFWRWMANTALYSGVGAAASAAVSGLAGYALAKFRFPGRTAIFNVILAGVLVPGITLAIPQFLLLARVELTNTYLSVLLPSIINPFGIYLARIFAGAAIPDSVIEAGRTDGASEWRIFQVIAAPMMMPGLVTIFLFQFVAIWNNFLLPQIMISDDRKFPVTVGLYTLLNQGVGEPALYTLVVAGSLLSVIPLILLFLYLQRFWRADLLTGVIKA